MVKDLESEFWKYYNEYVRARENYKRFMMKYKKVYDDCISIVKKYKDDLYYIIRKLEDSAYNIISDLIKYLVCRANDDYVKIDDGVDVDCRLIEIRVIKSCFYKYKCKSYYTPYRIREYLGRYYISKALPEPLKPKIYELGRLLSRLHRMYYNAKVKATIGGVEFVSDDYHVRASNTVQSLNDIWFDKDDIAIIKNYDKALKLRKIVERRIRERVRRAERTIRRVYELINEIRNELPILVLVYRT